MTGNQRDMQWSRWYSSTTTCLLDIFGEGHPYHREFRERCSDHRFPDFGIGVGILQAAKSDVENGYVNGLVGIISGEVFSDVLAIAAHLLEGKLKDPAAIVVGIALEAHLKSLCKRTGIPLEFTDSSGDIKPKKASVLNAELCKQGIYGKLDEKLITGWQDLRNKAAHGQFDEYSLDQVQTVYVSVAEFISRTST
jgi:hypothetical protein